MRKYKYQFPLAISTAELSIAFEMRPWRVLIPKPKPPREDDTMAIFDFSYLDD